MVQNNEVLEHVEIGRGSYRNFSGIKSDFNKAGERRFSVFLPPDVAEYLEGVGWYVKHKPSRRDEGEELLQLDVAVGFDRWPPVITLISHDGVRSFLNSENVGLLDSVDIEDATMEIRPYNWEVNGKTGCKAYLKELTVIAKPPRRALNASIHGESGDEDPF
ncbi:MAG: hypothetical protein II545_06580 [Lachnospiraceae bacterium]|nr:hypothetical protein [Lachnospiraceae bacterium]